MTKLRITTSLFNYKHIIQILADKGREQFGKHFQIYTEDLEVFIPIIAWMLRDEDVANQFDIDLRKGIFLGGPVGAGKTTIMQLMQLLGATPLNYDIQNCDRISAEFSKKGPAALDRYEHRSWCFDDMGTEDPAHHYRTTCQVMKKIIMRRYELYTENGIITHFTSSLTPAAIEKKYGKEVRSRLREMVNRVMFNEGTKDKRGGNNL